MTISTGWSLASGSIYGLKNIGPNGITVTSSQISDDGYPTYNFNVFSCDLNHDFSLLGTIGGNATQATWSVYMSSSAYGATSQLYSIPAPPDHAGIMGKFTGAPTASAGIHITSESNGSTAANIQTLLTGLTPPNIESGHFNFSSSNSQSFNSPIQITLEQSSDCVCFSLDDDGSLVNNNHKTHANLIFKPSTFNTDAFRFVVPDINNRGLYASSGTNPNLVPPAHHFVIEPTLGVSIPKYTDVVIMSFHSGSNIETPHSMSSIVSKAGTNPFAPYLTLSFDCPTLAPPIYPILKSYNLTGNTQGSVDAPNLSEPFWPGPSSKPSRSLGITSGTTEVLEWEWHSRQIAVYQEDGVLLTHGGGGPGDPPLRIYTGSFTDTMLNSSSQECPSYFPSNRDNQTVNGLYGNSTKFDNGHTPYGAAEFYLPIYSCSVMFECTLSRKDTLSGVVLQTMYASCSVMFTRENQ
tara:strand:+ start:218 stop:1612 length:1395 start_codon:yes stop_codon:yes gene_type:complete